MVEGINDVTGTPKKPVLSNPYTSQRINPAQEPSKRDSLKDHDDDCTCCPDTSPEALKQNKLWDFLNGKGS